MIHYYFGNGKGKTSAAVGACIRAAGSGMRCAVIQFLKNGISGEVRPLRSLGISVLACDFAGVRFFRDMSPQEQAAVIQSHNENLRIALASDCEFLVLDELGDAVNKNAVDLSLVRALLADSARELIVTGHREAPLFLECADYITKFQCVAHPFQHGQTARRGIEF